uniref:Odorant receptor n=1 Tax=Tribolium castaneum TaxID=7070 RepID=C0Z3Q3_TRICA|nr:olfactory receptor 6 [Tribolium castaneum]
MSPHDSGTFARIRKIFSILVYTSTVVLSMAELFFNYKDLETVIRATESFFTQYGLAWKIAVFVVYKTELAQIIRLCDNLWPLDEFGTGHNFQFLHKFLRRFFLLYTGNLALLCTQFAVTAFFDDQFKSVMVYYGEKESRSQIYDNFVFTLQVIYLYVGCFVVAGFDCFFFYLLGHAVTELKMLTISFSCKEIGRNWGYEERFKCSVKHHIHVLELLDKINKVYSVMLLNQHLCSLFVQLTQVMDKVEFSDPLFFLNVIGMHPFKADKFSKFRLAFSIAVYFAVIFSGVLELIVNSQGLETYARASDTLIPQCQLVCKIFVLAKYKKQIARLLNGSQRFWDLGQFGARYGNSFGKTHKYLKSFFLLYKVMLTFTCLQFLAVKIIFKIPKPIAISFGETKGLEPLYDHLYLVLHAMITLVTINLVNGFDGLFFYFIGHVLTELKMVKVAFGDSPIETNWSEEKRFKFAVRHHRFVLE